MMIVELTLTGVETHVTATTPQGTLPGIPTSLRYFVSDPFAIHITFPARTPDDQPNTWRIWRDWLDFGMETAVGSDEIRVQPHHSPAGRFVLLTLSSPDGTAIIEIPFSAVLHAVQYSLYLVPRGQERAHLRQ